MGKWRDVFGPDRRRSRSFGRVREPKATILDLDPGSIAYAVKLRRLRRKEQRFGTPGLTAVERRFVRRERESEKAMTELERAVWALEVKGVSAGGKLGRRGFLGSGRMSKRQFRAEMYKRQTASMQVDDLARGIPGAAGLGRETTAQITSGNLRRAGSYTKPTRVR